MLTAILAAAVVFFGFGTLYEIYEERDWPKSLGPKFLLVSGFLLWWVCL